MKSSLISWIRRSFLTERWKSARASTEVTAEGASGDSVVDFSGDDRSVSSFDETSSLDVATVPIAGSGPLPAPAPLTPELLSFLRQSGLDRYTDQGLIGRGGMGRVHRVLDKTLLRDVALKVLRPELESKERQVQRFIREAQITAQLDHPSIAPIHELGYDEETGFYISMKLVDGETLDHLLERTGDARLQPERLAGFLQVFIKVCEAMAFAHSRGVIHRDIKPANIMVGRFGQVYLMDWGVARLLPEKGDAPPRYAMVSEELTAALDEKPGNVVGTPRYMPPEQIKGQHEQIDERSDIFALGGTLYQVLTARPPYASRNYYSTLLEALDGDIAHPDTVVGPGRVPPGLSRIALRALAFEPAERYASVAELQRDVESFLRGAWDQVIRTFPAGARILTEGEEGNEAYIILGGRCSVFTESGDRRVVLREMGPGEVFAETALFASSERTASVEAIDEVTLKVVSRETLTDGLGLNSWMGSFVKALADRFREVDEKLRRLELEKAEAGEGPTGE